MTNDDDVRWPDRAIEFGRLQAGLQDALRRLERTENKLEKLIWWIMVSGVGAAMGAGGYALRLLIGGL